MYPHKSIVYILGMEQNDTDQKESKRSISDVAFKRKDK